MAKKLISDETIVIDLLTVKGYTDSKAASELGVSKMTISRIRIRHNIKPKSKHTKDQYTLSQETNDNLRVLYFSGKNDYEISTLMHIGRGTLRKWRMENGVSSQSNKKGLNKKDADDMYALYCSGIKTDQIAVKYGLNRTSVSRHLKKNGFKVIDNRNMPSDIVLNSPLKEYQKQVLIGELFGDGGICSTSDEKAHYYFAQSNNQDFFTFFKYTIFKDFIVNVYTNKKYSAVNVSTWSTPYFKKWHRVFYPDGKKVLTGELIRYVDPISLAVWYMGDGSLNRKTPTFHVGLSVDLIPIAIALTEKFGLFFEAIPYEKEWHLKVRDAYKFFDIISPFCIRGFEYKLFEEFHVRIASGWNSLSCANVTPDIFNALSKEDKNRVIDTYVTFYIQRGFPYPRYNLGDIKRELILLSKTDIVLRDKIIVSNDTGVKICNNYFPHRFDGLRYDSNPMTIWKDEVKLRDFFVDRFRYSKGPVTDSVIRAGLQLKGVPANFSPSVAKYIYQSFLPSGGITVDFSAGYGARLLGFMASGTSGIYNGFEPYTKSYNGLNKMAGECSSTANIDRNRVNLINKPFEECELNFSSDLIFSSPPYYDLEIYTNEDTQSIKRYPDYSVWLDKFWGEVVRKCYSSLRENGYFIYSIGNYRDYDLIKDTLDILKNVGLRHCNTLKISYHNACKNRDKLESLFIFKK